MIPMRLRRGDKIGIVSPSTPVTKDLNEQFEQGIEFLEGLGFRPVIGEHVYSK